MNLSKEFIEEMNKLGKASEPFLFVIDFEQQKPFIKPLHDLSPSEVLYSCKDGFINYSNFYKTDGTQPKALQLLKNPLSYEVYKNAFSLVKHNLELGNSFLTNLTGETEIYCNWTFEELFHYSKAKYKVCFPNEFLSFSPESFVLIDEHGVIASYPMKGTIEAHVPNAEQIILNSEKEKYEHTTIVDLIRNDLSKVARKVWVEKFRYIDKIHRENEPDLLQVSSEIKGELTADWKLRLGHILNDLLPAGSISGAPKNKTVEIIQAAEKSTFHHGKRGYYTGVFGVFDGRRLSSAVMIRFIEKRGDQLFFKSGGGITSRSNPKEEYEELLSKIYVPLR